MSFSDIKSIFQKGLSAVIELINSLYAQIKELTEKNTNLASTNKKLEERIKELTEQKSKDSHNSSKPSSTDGMKKKTNTFDTHTRKLLLSDQEENPRVHPADRKGMKALRCRWLQNQIK